MSTPEPLAPLRENTDESSLAVGGERGIPSVNRIRSIQSRVTAFLATGFVMPSATRRRARRLCARKVK
jgi:hypothetical protein